MLKYLLIALTGFVLIFAGVSALNLWFFTRIVSDAAEVVGQSFEGEPVVERVSLLEGVDLEAGGYALVLDDLVTGRRARLIRDPAELRALSPSLWYDDTRLEGGLFSALNERARARTVLATLLKDGVAIRQFTCVSEDCAGWFSTGDREGAQHSGFAALRDAAEAPGEPVELVTGYYDNYASYRSAHAAIAADPGRWFAQPGGERLLTDAEGLGQIRVTLPVDLLPYAASAASPEQEDAAAAALLAVGERWLGGVEGRVWVDHSWPADIYILWQPGFEGEGRPIFLPGVSFRQSWIRFEMAPAMQARVLAQIDLSGFAPPDLLGLEDALFRAVSEAGYDTACLPGCARIETQRIKHGAESFARPDPGWQIESWRLMPVQP